tara:strand:+ start:32705 stop:33058 length:354 start_codon:yes stop_codon:yes gene_type:complete
MAETERGIALLKFGTSEVTGYIVENRDISTEGENLEIEDEIGDVATDISGFGIRKKKSVKFIPKATGSTEPDPGDVIDIGDSEKLVVKTCKKVNVRKDVERWDIEGYEHPNIDISGS